jgi:hypothetical protein
MARTATYLYCIVHAAKAPALTGVPRGIPGASRPTRRDAGKSLWMILAEVPLDVYGSDALQSALGDLDWVGRVAMAHERVIEHFSQRRELTVVPMKLFTMFSTADRAVDETRVRTAEISAIVERIAGCDEWGVRVTKQPLQPTRPVVRTAQTASGAAFLESKKQTRDAARESIRVAVESAQTTYETLAAIARDARRRDDVPQGAAVVPLLDAAFLVPGENRARFKSALTRLGARSATAGVDLAVTGPWPAYNFVQLDSHE